MYLSYYNLKKRPFQITTDPEILWWGDRYKKACASLKKGVSESTELIVLTGDIGLGKTTLINALIQSFDDKTLVAKLAAPDPESFVFHKFVAGSFGLDLDFRSKDELLASLADFFGAVSRYGQKVVLIIDEAHLCNHTHFKEIYDLLSLGENQNWGVTVILVGQNELKYSLATEKNGMLGKKVTVSYQIDPLTRNETDDYIHHCLKLVGSEKRIFSFDAIEEIYAYSKGNPHLINILCDLTLATGCVTDSGTINSGVVIESAKKLQLRRPASEDELENRKILYRQRSDVGAAGAKKYFNRLVFYLALPVGALVVGGYFYLSSPPIPAEKLDEPVVLEKKIIAIQPDKSQKASITPNRLIPAANNDIDEGLKPEVAPVFKKTPTWQEDNYVSSPISISSATQQPPRLDIKTSTPHEDKDDTKDEALQVLLEKKEIVQVKKPTVVLPDEVSTYEARSDQIDAMESPADEVAVKQVESDQKDKRELPLKTENITQESLTEPFNSGEMEDPIDYEVIANQKDQNIISNQTDQRDEESEADVSVTRKQSSDTLAEEPDPAKVIDWLIKKRSQ
jgi:type II secretory pathway predicted ATPase ExeA